MQGAVSSDVIRTEAWDKVTGAAAYNDDEKPSACLHARILTSTFAHARLIAVDTSEAGVIEGVHAVVTGADCDVFTGSVIQDMPVLAKGKVRYYGEPVAIAVADEEWQAALAVEKIRMRYEPLAVVNSPSQALAAGAAVIHEDLGQKVTLANTGNLPECIGRLRKIMNWDGKDAPE
ncbi:MAG: hypothetical protein ACOYU3_01905 [Bacillota bacterium]